MSDLDERLVVSLRSRADGEVDADALLAAAMTRGRAQRARRRLALAGGAGLVVVALVAVGAVANPLEGAAPFAAGGSDAAAAPPAAPGVPAAASRPDLVGTDPGLLHFGVDPSAARYLSWRSAPGMESVRLDLGKGRQVTVDLARSADGLEKPVHEDVPYSSAEVTEESFGGRSGTVEEVPPAGPGGRPGWILRWRPAEGLWARAAAYAQTDADVWAAVTVLRLDEARRCAVPFRLTELPTGSRITSCTVSLIGHPESVDASVLVAGPDGQTMEVQMQYAQGRGPVRTEGNRRINGHPAYLYPGKDELELLGYPDTYVSARIGKGYSGYGEAEATAVLAGLEMPDEVVGFASWPNRLGPD